MFTIRDKLIIGVTMLFIDIAALFFMPLIIWLLFVVFTTLTLAKLLTA